MLEIGFGLGIVILALLDLAQIEQGSYYPFLIIKPDSRVIGSFEVTFGLLREDASQN